jgi:hypothetical protein
MLVNWVTNYKKKLGKGALTLASMEKSKAKDSEELKTDQTVHSAAIDHLVPELQSISSGTL